MLIIFFDVKGIVRDESVPRDYTMNQKYYIELLSKLPKRILRKRLELWDNGWILHQDTAPAHSVLVQQFLAKT
jgi:hypothetical protein